MINHFIEKNTIRIIPANANQRKGTLTEAGAALSYQPGYGLIVSDGKATLEGVYCKIVATEKQLNSDLKKICKGVKFVLVTVDLINHCIKFTILRPSTVLNAAADCLTTESKKKNNFWSNRLCFKKNTSFDAIEGGAMSFFISYREWNELSEKFIDFVEELPEKDKKIINKSINGYIAESYFYNGDLEGWYKHFKAAKKASDGTDIDAYIGIQPIQIKCSLQNDPEYGFFCKESKGTSKSNGFGLQLDRQYGFKFADVLEELRA